MKLVLFSLFFLLAYFGKSQCTNAGSALATSYASNNGGKGVMFNVVATNAITLTCFDLNLILGSVGRYEVYYKTGSYVGSENNAAAWTLIGSNPSVPCVGFDYPSPLNIPINLFMAAGQTYGFYITTTDVSSTAGVRYINGTAYTTIASDANVAIAGGVGKAYPFLATFSNRNFNGTLHYAPGNVLPVELTAFDATPLDGAVRLNWSTASESRNDYFMVERSADGFAWTTLHRIDGAGSIQQKNDYEAFDLQPLPGVSYYRLSQTDFDGRTTIFPLKSVERHHESPLPEKLILFPNPATTTVKISGLEQGAGGITVTNILGQDLSNRIPISREADAALLDLSAIEEKQLLFVKCGHRSAVLVKQ